MKSSREESDGASNILWVGNLCPDVTDSDLMDFFAKYGALGSVITHASRNFAFLYFKRATDASAAKDALQGMKLRRNPVKIDFARPARPSKHLWVSGISLAVSKEQLEEEFLKYGKINELTFLRDRNIAFIEYGKLENALEAMKSMNGKQLGAEPICVDFLRSQYLGREQFTDSRHPRDSQFSVPYSVVRRIQHSQPSGLREGPPSNVLWVGYPPSVLIGEQMLHNAMILFGEIERIKNFPSRNFSFVEFRSVDEARRAKEGLQGRLFGEPGISIMYASSELAPGGEYSSFLAGGKGPRLEILKERLFGSNQLEVLGHCHPIGLHMSPRPLPPSNDNRSNIPLQPLGPHGSLDPEPVLAGTEPNDPAPLYSFHNGSSSIRTGPNWRKPSLAASEILPSPISRVRPPMMPVSTGWDVLEPNKYQREPKRSKIDTLSPIDEDSFPLRKIDDQGLGFKKTCRIVPPIDAGISGPFVNVQGKGTLSPVGGKAAGGPDFLWRGIIAKGGTPVCNARCVPFDKGIDLELPEVVNCSARTGLDMLTKHYAEATGFDVFFFLPDNEDDFSSYTEFLRYLGSKNRAGVAKFDDGTTLFLVPPSGFLTEVLKVKGPERLYGVILKLPPQIPSSASTESQQRQPNHIPQHIEKHIPPPQLDNIQIARKEERMMSLDSNRISYKDLKPSSNIVCPQPTESIVEQSVHQEYASSNTVAGSQAGVSWTPELIACLTSLLPAKAEPSVLDGGQPASSTSVGYAYLSVGSQLNSQSEALSLLQSYPSVSNAPNGSDNMNPGTSQIQDASLNLRHLGRFPSRSLTSVTMPSQSGQTAVPPYVSLQYQPEVSQHNIYGGMVHVTGGSYSTSVTQQSNNTLVFSSQAQSSHNSQTKCGMSQYADKVNWEVPNQMQQFPSATSVAGHGTSEVEVDKNQRYQSTLQFAASLLLQIQQKQQQHRDNAAVQGSGNQQ